MKAKYDQVMQGASFEGVSLGLGIMFIFFSLVTSGLIFIYLPKILVLISILLFIAGIILILSIVVLEFDTINKRYRESTYLIFFRLKGKWISLKSYDKIVLKPDREILLYQSNFSKNSAANFGYEIYFVDSINNRELFFYRSVDIPKAQKLLREYAKKLDLEMVDEIQEGWRRCMDRRKLRRSGHRDII